MKHPGNINIERYTYDLPQEKIALYPLEKRDRSKLLVYRSGDVSAYSFRDITRLLPGNSLLLVNETRVIQARLIFRKSTGSLIEIFCLEPAEPSGEYEQVFSATSECTWNCLVGNSRRWRSGKLEMTSIKEDETVKLIAERVDKEEAGSRVRFQWYPDEFTFAEVLDLFGIIPLPPYIKREVEKSDRDTYQTVYAKNSGSVAAPTAGLHFTNEVLSELSEKNVTRLPFTLHVGAGTFRPVSTPELIGHKMHSERVSISRNILLQLHEQIDNPKIVVGTTSTRLVESIYWLGVKWSLNKPDIAEMDISQWEPYKELHRHKLSPADSLENVIDTLDRKGLDTLQGNTELIIAPGYEYAIPDIMVTNFHQPRSTLLLLIAAFIGEDWRKAYQFALENDFRFLSYGDSCLFFKG